ncbi:MerR family transcriptional regulator [Streptomyces sp. S.PB5]|uniref:MerR family transcriptional regulator n=1 Tax=Streptomyces sp. S.PB5 TaxID=3020844 RepID=UPI0025AEF280|nr:MerR family transcriptional regulator [Streptomyces sp. S.PB5]MDN3020444.1 MerR family transcriptional regulator [Streptomyces sp. S.PB5]
MATEEIDEIDEIDGTLTIAETSELTGFSPSTLRYYERIGLIDGVARGHDGRRRYQAADLTWMAFLLRLRTTRMPIRAMVAFAKLRRSGDATVRERLELLRRHQAQVRREYEAVMRSLDAIDDKIAYYERLVEERDGDSGREA